MNAPKKQTRKKKIAAEIARQKAMKCELVGTPSPTLLDAFWREVIDGNLNKKAQS